MTDQREMSPDDHRDGLAPRVSVVMVFHNARRFIGEAIASVQAQAFRGWELVLVDDGSDDGSRDFVAGLVATDPGRMRLVRHPDGGNHGTGASRNLGVSAARGEFLAFLDADDVYLPGRLERHLELLDHHADVALVQSRVEFWHSWSGDAGRPPDRVEPLVPVPLGRPIDPPQLLNLLLRSNGYTAPAVCSLTIRMTEVRRVGGFESAFREAFEDQVLLAKLYLQARTLVIDDVLARYRQHPDSLVHRLEREGTYVPGWPNRAEEAFLEWLQGHVADLGVESRELHDALRMALRPYTHPWEWRLTHLPMLALRSARRLAQRALPPALVAPVLDLRRQQKERAAARRAQREGRSLEASSHGHSGGEGDT